MTDSRAAVGLDRLPWLTDEPKVGARGSSRELLGWAAAAFILVAGGSYWLGTQSGGPDDAPIAMTAPSKPESSVKLPEARLPSPPPPVAIAPTPEVRPSPPARVAVPEARVESPVRPKRRTVLKREEPSRARLNQAVQSQSRESSPEEAKPVAATAAPAPPARARELRLWNSRQSAGASGRLVQIGAFGSRQQAKLGWRRMQRSYPAVARLPAVVVEARNSRGKRFYRFQIGTTSQAHSEVLCQRMRSIRYSCAVVGLPWKAKVER